MKRKVLIVVGPTASGKSSLGVDLARIFGGEVISADSRQVYKGLDIGTGKITKKEMKGVKHHMLDIASPKRNFSAGDFAKKAFKAHSNILQNVRMSIIVGGTGFYIDAFTGRIQMPEVEPDPVLRKKLGSKTTAQLYSLLTKLDPKRAQTMDTPSERNNRVRLIRAIEIAKSPKMKKMSEFVTRPYDYLWIGLRPKDEDLKKRINRRLKERINGGMITEAKRLHASGLSYKRMEELGLEYRSLARHLKGLISKDEMERELQSDIWRYARKQIGYWKRNKDIAWFEPNEKGKIQKLIRAWLKK